VIETKTKTKTPIQIVQELLAIHTTRKEATEKLIALRLTIDTAAEVRVAAQDNDEAIAEWMGELSNYGDAVMASVDQENEYQKIYKNALGMIDAMTLQEREETFRLLEDSLKRTYQHTIAANTELPASTNEILNRQLNKLIKV
jgi:hypothetical protein